MLQSFGVLGLAPCHFTCRNTCRYRWLIRPPFPHLGIASLAQVSKTGLCPLHCFTIRNSLLSEGYTHTHPWARTPTHTHAHPHTHPAQPAHAPARARARPPTPTRTPTPTPTPTHTHTPTPTPTTTPPHPHPPPPHAHAHTHMHGHAATLQMRIRLDAGVRALTTHGASTAMPLHWCRVCGTRS